MQLWRHYAVWAAGDLYVSDRLLLCDLSHHAWMCLKEAANALYR